MIYVSTTSHFTVEFLISFFPGQYLDSYFDAVQVGAGGEGDQCEQAVPEEEPSGYEGAAPHPPEDTGVLHRGRAGDHEDPGRHGDGGGGERCAWYATVCLCKGWGGGRGK